MTKQMLTRKWPHMPLSNPRHFYMNFVKVVNSLAMTTWTLYSVIDLAKIETKISLNTSTNRTSGSIVILWQECPNARIKCSQWKRSQYVTLFLVSAALILSSSLMIPQRSRTVTLKATWTTWWVGWTHRWWPPWCKEVEECQEWKRWLRGSDHTVHSCLPRCRMTYTRLSILQNSSTIENSWSFYILSSVTM